MISLPARTAEEVRQVLAGLLALAGNPICPDDAAALLEQAAALLQDAARRIELQP